MIAVKCCDNFNEAEERLQLLETLVSVDMSAAKWAVFVQQLLETLSELDLHPTTIEEYLDVNGYGETHVVQQPVPQPQVRYPPRSSADRVQAGIKAAANRNTGGRSDLLDRAVQEMARLHREAFQPASPERPRGRRVPTSPVKEDKDMPDVVEPDSGNPAQKKGHRRGFLDEAVNRGLRVNVDLPPLPDTGVDQSDL
jgi:hypothetical protein